MFSAAVLALALTDVPLCPFAALTGVPCPGCGLTRATVSLLRGDLGAAFRYHPLAPAVLAFLATFGGVVVAPPRNAIAAVVRRALPWLAGALLAALVAVWAARFFGWLGGPVPVESVFEWLRR